MDLILLLLALGAGVGAAVGVGGPSPDAAAAPPEVPQVAAPEVAAPEVAAPEGADLLPPAAAPKVAPSTGAFTALPKAPDTSVGTFAPLPDADATDAPGVFTALPAPETATAQAEDQTPTGKFTTTTEVKPILTATQGSWVALRDFDGQDLLYFTQLLTWRCGLVGISYAVNGGAPQAFDAEPCYTDTAQPNAIRANTMLPYLTFPPGSVQSVTVDLTYDDLTTATATFARPQILMP